MHFGNDKLDLIFYRRNVKTTLILRIMFMCNDFRLISKISKIDTILRSDSDNFIHLHYS